MNLSDLFPDPASLPDLTPSLKPVELTGERAVLLPLQMEHVEALFQAGNDPRIWQFMPYQVSSLEGVERFAQDALLEHERGTGLPFTVLDRETGRIVGSTRYLDVQPLHRGLEIGWTWLSPDVWRTRINTECKYLLLRYAFETLGMIRVQFKTDARNVRSQAAIERLGATKEGVLRHHRIMPDGYLRDSVYYSLLMEEWPEVKARLECRLHRC